MCFKISRSMNNLNKTMYSNLTKESNNIFKCRSESSLCIESINCNGYRSQIKSQGSNLEQKFTSDYLSGEYNSKLLNGVVRDAKSMGDICSVSSSETSTDVIMDCRSYSFRLPLATSQNSLRMCKNNILLDSSKRKGYPNFIPLSSYLHRYNKVKRGIECKNKCTESLCSSISDCDNDNGSEMDQNKCYDHEEYELYQFILHGNAKVKETEDDICSNEYEDEDSISSAELTRANCSLKNSSSLVLKEVKPTKAKAAYKPHSIRDYKALPSIKLGSLGPDLSVMKAKLKGPSRAMSKECVMAIALTTRENMMQHIIEACASVTEATLVFNEKAMIQRNYGNAANLKNLQTIARLRERKKNDSEEDRECGSIPLLSTLPANQDTNNLKNGENKLLNVNSSRNHKVNIETVLNNKKENKSHVRWQVPKTGIFLHLNHQTHFEQKTERNSKTINTGVNKKSLNKNVSLHDLQERHKNEKLVIEKICVNATS